MKHALIGAAVAAILPAIAAAEGMTNMDLGQFSNRESCMAKAEQVMERYIRTHGGFEFQSTEWVVYGWDFTPGDQDVSIMCPWVSDTVVNAFLVVHGETTDEERIFTAETLERFWQGRK
jgi:hypothetical protein